MGQLNENKGTRDNLISIANEFIKLVEIYVDDRLK